MSHQRYSCNIYFFIKQPEKASKITMADENVKDILDVCVSKLQLLATNIEGKELPEVRIIALL
jgi:hypothetical protein